MEDCRIVEYDPKRHLEGCAEALASGFHHNHWPLWDRASPRLAKDVVRMAAAPSNLCLVVEDASGRARGQIFCSAPMTRMRLLGLGSAVLKVLGITGTGLYFMRPVAWRHFFALRGYLPLLLQHPINNPHFEVTLFVCHQELQGKGWGSRLMHEAVMRMHEKGADEVVLITDSTMAWEFYEHYGYQRTVDVPLGPTYTVAMDSDTERGYIYALDVPKKIAQLA